MKIIVKNNQTLADIAIQEYGTLEGVFLLAQANDISPTDTLATGKKLTRPDVVLNKEMESYCKKNNVSPATAQTVDSPIRLRIFTEQFTEQFK